MKTFTLVTVFMILQVVDATRLDLFRFPETLLSTYKKCTAGRVTSKFYMGQNEDDSPGDSSSDTSEKLLQRGRGKVSIYVVLVKGKYMQSITYFLQVSASH